MVTRFVFTPRAYANGNGPQRKGAATVTGHFEGIGFERIYTDAGWPEL
jgi:hypothetical protein